VTPTNDQIVAEAERRWAHEPRDRFVTDYIIEVVREGWTPPEPVVDQDVLAFREWATTLWPNVAEGVLHGNMDYTEAAKGFLAGARMAREAEAERAKVLVEPAEAIVNRAVKGTGANDVRWPHILKAARRLEAGLNAYKAGKEAAQ